MTPLSGVGVCQRAAAILVLSRQLGVVKNAVATRRTRARALCILISS